MKQFCCLLFMICCVTSYAQVEEPINDEPIIIGDPPKERMATLTSNKGSHGVYFGLTSGYSQVNDKDLLSMGVKFAYVADTKFEFGLAFEGLQSEKGISTVDDIPLYLSAGMGGFHFEPILLGRKSVHLAFPIFVGGGVAYLYEEQIWDFDSEPPFEPVNSDRFQEWEPLLVIQPGANVVFNIARFLQIEAGVKYRFTNELDLNNHDLQDLNGFIGGVGLKIGFFDFGGYGG